MYYQQTRETILIKAGDKLYTESLENAEIDGMIIPELDEKYDYRIYEKEQDGSHRRHALIGGHGTICDEGGEDWEPGDEAFNDLPELCKRQIDRLTKAEQDFRDHITMHIDAQNENAQFDINAKLNSAEYKEEVAKAAKADDDAFVARLERLGFKRSV